MKARIQKHFNEFIYDGLDSGYIYHDLKIATEQNLNYLVSLGLLCYTEYLGSLMPKSLNENRQPTSRNKFNRFLFRLDLPYSSLDKIEQSRYFIFNDLLQHFHNNKKDIYSIFRCGLVHEYFIKKIVGLKTEKLSYLKPFSVIARNSVPKESIAFGQVPNGRMAMAYMNYFRDFKTLLVNWRKKLFEEGDPIWIKAFTN